MDDGAPLPETESKRLERVAQLCARDTQEDPVFNKIVAMTAEYFKAPIALISIVDEHEQWFKARVGIEECSTPRSASFCAYSLLDNQPLEILDARSDPRFKSNLLVTGAPFIRYYASAPLLTDDGLSLGSLCFIDTVAREPMNSRDAAMLSHLAELVMMQIMGVRSRNYIDQPTGLFNRLRFEEDIREALGRGAAITIYAVDVTSPKFLNDVVKALGYRFAEDLILEIKRRLQGLLPSGCLLYKISPTRFGFLLPGNVERETISTRIIENFKTAVECHGIPIPMQVGIGALPITSSDEQDWLRLVISTADAARDRGLGYLLYEPTFDAAQRRAFTLLSSLSEALHVNDQLRLVFQPKISLPGGACAAVEALLRWDHPQLGTISPAEFIPLAEKTALMPSLTSWVLGAVIEQATLWREQGLDLKIAMNVTVGDLESPAFVDTLIDRLTARHLRPDRLELEFTESTLMTDPSEVVRQLTRLRNLGVVVAIDDFGTGYSNWTYLTTLPTSTVKLDQSLISNLTTNEKDKRLVKTLIELASGLGYRVVAEGVETQEIFNLVKAWGCHEAQGYLIAKPMPANELEAWVSHYLP